MRIAFLAPDTDLAGLSGDVAHVLDLTCSLARAGCTIDLVVANQGVWQPPHRVQVHVVSWRDTLLLGLALYSILRRHPPDIIYERRSTPKLAALLGFLLLRPYFVEINGLADEERTMLGSPETRAAWTSSLRLAFRGMLLKRARGIITVTDGLKEYLVQQHRIPGSLIAVVGNGVDISRFREVPGNEARASLGLPIDGNYVIFVGNLVRWHGVHVVIESMRRILAKNPDVVLLIIGDGPERKPLEAQVEKSGLRSCVRFTGWVARESVPKWIAAADICVLPLTLARNAKIGTAALKLSEYLSCGRPVVATNLPGAGPFIELNGAGLGFRGDDPEDLAEKIVALLANPATRAEMGRRGKDVAARLLTWDEVARKLLALFQRNTGSSDLGSEFHV